MSDDLSRCGHADHHPGSDAEPVVVVCQHILDGDGEATTMTITRDAPVRHNCSSDDCPETALCGDCWSNL